MGFWSEFKEFAVKGNMVDMAVGIIIGAAFGKVVSSLVADIIMPPVGMMLGETDFAALKVMLSPAVMDGEKVVKPEAAIRYGAFIQTLIDFLIVAVTIFVVLKGMNIARQRALIPFLGQPAAPPAGTTPPKT